MHVAKNAKRFLRMQNVITNLYDTERIPRGLPSLNERWICELEHTKTL